MAIDTIGIKFFVDEYYFDPSVESDSWKIAKGIVGLGGLIKQDPQFIVDLVPLLLHGSSDLSRRDFLVRAIISANIPTKDLVGYLASGVDLCLNQKGFTTNIKKRKPYNTINDHPSFDWQTFRAKEELFFTPNPSPLDYQKQNFALVELADLASQGEQRALDLLVKVFIKRYELRNNNDKHRLSLDYILTAIFSCAKSVGVIKLALNNATNEL